MFVSFSILFGTIFYILSINNILNVFLNYSPSIQKKDYSSNYIYSPTQGTIQDISTENGINGELTTIRVFLAPLDNHTQYYPVNGKVSYKNYKKGEFYPAYMFKKTKYNESYLTIINFDITTQMQETSFLHIKQIAGILARRIRTYNEIGDSVVYGDKLGKILLGSAVDITIDSNIYKPSVHIGDKVLPLQTILFKRI